jgi:hypothetical protein
VATRRTKRGATRERKAAPPAPAKPSRGKRGRPTLCTPEVTAEICRRLMLGESLIKITRDPKMPAEDTVYGWLADAWGSTPKPECLAFSEKYVRAREVQQERAGDESIDIADTVKARRDDVAKAKLRVETRKWVAERMSPKRYGTKQTLEHTGPGGGPIPHRIERVIVDAKKGPDAD